MQAEQRVAIVSGGGRGIGAAAGHALAADGIAVALVARTEAEVETVAAEIRHKGGRAAAIVADIAKSGAASTVANEAARQLSRPCDILVNAAGTTGPIAELAELDPDDFRNVLDVNLVGALALAQAVLPAMRDRGSGRIVNVTSGLARRAQPGIGAYSASKAALMHLSAIMDAENGERGVRVFALEPGVVRSRMNEQLMSSGETAIGARVVRMLREMERAPGFVEPADSAQLIRLAASGRADDLAGKPFSIYDDEIRARLAA